MGKQTRPRVYIDDIDISEVQKELEFLSAEEDLDTSDIESTQKNITQSKMIARGLELLLEEKREQAMGS